MTRKQLEVLGTMIVVTVLSGCGPDDGADAEDVDVVTGEATKWYCGSQCNEKAPNWVVPSNGVQCSRSAVHLGSGHPTNLSNQADTYMTVHVYYSTVCETMWATATNSRATGRTFCQVGGYKWDSPSYVFSTDCPPAGTSVTTRMIDDHDPNYGVAAEMFLAERNAQGPFDYRFEY